jgi:hypothetical protein
MSLHRYWRVQFSKSNGSNTNIRLAEVSFRSAANVDLSVGGTPIASGFFGVGFEAANAFDKSVAVAANGWASPAATFPCWIGYDHSSAVDVASVLVTCSAASAASDRLPVDAAVFLEWSDNGSTWAAEGPLTWRTEGDWALGAVVRLVAGTPVSSAIASPLARLNGNVQDQSVLRGTDARGQTYRLDIVDGGTGVISGVVTIENIPGARKVRLYRKHDGRLMRETWSAPTGHYSFNNIDPTLEYFVVAHDHLRVYNGVIQDMLTP